MTLPRPVLVCFALPEEAAFCAALKQAHTSCPIVVTGVGAHNAAVRSEQAIRKYTPRLVLTCGYAGGLKPGLALGTILFSADPETRLGPKLLELGGVPAQFHCSTRIAWSAAEKAALWLSTKAEAVEMESGVIRQVAKERGVPSATIRVISDTAEEDLPIDFNELLTKECKISYRKLAWQLARTPGKVPKLIKLQQHTRLAARRLGEVLQGLLLGSGTSG